MQDKLIDVIKKLIPELSELEAQGYTLNGTMQGDLAFDFEMSKEGKQPIIFAGYYRANAGKTTVKFERISEDGQSETADRTISKINRQYCLVEDVWLDEDENKRQFASISTIDPTVQMPCPKKVVLRNAHKTLSYKRYLKFGDKHILEDLLPHFSDENQ